MLITQQLSAVSALDDVLGVGFREMEHSHSYPYGFASK